MLRLLLSTLLLLPSHAHQFEDDLKICPKGLVLNASEASKVLVSPLHQGRVLVSTLDGESLGWLNREALVANSGGIGGADRFWFAPDGSQFSVFFEPGAEMLESNWRIPAAVARGEMKLVRQTERLICMKARWQLTNHPGTKFDVEIDRRVRVLDPLDVPDDVLQVGFRVENHVTNRGRPWKAESGLLSLWSLGTFAGGEKVEVRIPVKQPEHLRTYFLPFRENQLTFENGIARFICNGDWRSKLGMRPQHAPETMLSLDPDRRLLTVVRFAKPEGTRFPRAERGPQDPPYDGDLINVYNHGNIDNSPLPERAFYELESASAMPELQTGEHVSHWHEVRHFRADLKTLESLADRFLAE